MLLRGLVGTLHDVLSDSLDSLLTAVEVAPIARRFLEIERKLANAIGVKRVELLREWGTYLPNARAELKGQSEISKPDRSTTGITLDESLPVKGRVVQQRRFPALTVMLREENRHFYKLRWELRDSGIPEEFIREFASAGMTSVQVQEAYLREQIRREESTVFHQADVELVKPAPLEVEGKKLPPEVLGIARLVKIPSLEAELEELGLSKNDLVAALVIGFRYGSRAPLIGREVKSEAEIAESMKPFGLGLDQVLSFLKRHRMLNRRGDKLSINITACDSTGSFVHRTINAAVREFYKIEGVSAAMREIAS